MARELASEPSENEIKLSVKFLYISVQTWSRHVVNMKVDLFKCLLSAFVQYGLWIFK